MNSIQVPDFFEEELNLIPTHTIGVAAYGSFALGGERTLNWTVSVGNGRARVPDQAVYARDFSENKEVTGLLELILPGFKDSRVGVSGWLGAIDSVRVDEPERPGRGPEGRRGDGACEESGLDVYAVVNTRHFSLNAEWVFSWQKDQLGNLPDSEYSMNGGLVEASLHLRNGKLHPYLRYDRTSFDHGGGPYPVAAGGRRRRHAPLRAGVRVGHGRRGLRRQRPRPRQGRVPAPPGRPAQVRRRWPSRSPTASRGGQAHARNRQRRC